jgi:hypothetical protein
LLVRPHGEIYGAHATPSDLPDQTPGSHPATFHGGFGGVIGHQILKRVLHLLADESFARGAVAVQ